MKIRHPMTPRHPVCAICYDRSQKDRQSDIEADIDRDRDRDRDMNTDTDVHTGIDTGKQIHRRTDT